MKRLIRRALYEVIFWTLYKPVERMCAYLRYSKQVVIMDKRFLNGVDASGSILDPDIILYREFEKHGLGKFIGPKIFKPRKDTFNVTITNLDKSNKVKYTFFIDMFYKEPKENK